MFASARIKLALWYSLIIMLISVLFSVTIFYLLAHELDRNYHRAAFLYQQRRDTPDVFEVPPMLDPGALEASENRIMLNLLYINLVILVVSATSGYFLAGRTLRPIQQMLDDQNRFITDASHELRTPLTSMKTSIEVNLRDKDLDLKQATGLLKSTLEEVNSMQILSDELLVLSQPNPNIKAVSRDKVLLQKVIDQAVSKVTALAQEKQVKIVQPKSMNDYAIVGNDESLTQLLIIFLDNAIKYSPAKSTVTVKVEKTDGTVKVSIIDRGIGIDPTSLPHIFDRFYRADESRSKESVTGFGLGLSIAKKIINACGGSVEVKSILNKGTTFILSFSSFSA